MASAVSADLLKTFLKNAAERLTGKWVLHGEAVLLALSIEKRLTYDIDIATLEDAAQNQTLLLKQIAEELGLALEAINHTAAFPLNSKEQLIELYRGRTAVFYRPNVNLYLRLKMARLSESDLSDAIALLSHARTHNEAADTNALCTEIKQAILEQRNPAKAERLKQLLLAVDKTKSS